LREVAPYAPLRYRATVELRDARGGAVAVHRSTVLPVPPARVWEALTDDDLLSRWFGADVTLDPRPGGRGVFRGPDGTRTASVREAEAEHRLSFDWDDEPDAGVDLTITAVPGGSRLDVVETPPAALDVPTVEASAGSHEAWSDWDLRLILLTEGVGLRVLAAV
jgi:uncharacterized protein YndB with AHSA1/START domain